ncbi:galactokinase [Pedobacter sandarakinus]|uniref:galactokinase n=1 Tax=Pedobacter sandarakinus TaxID=353156 RepID=UPI0022468809|nr:galactokinase [Pedobacter sandarakinus]MCX2575174.1 galactokinase [Pedobacter sandarakinus]
MDIERLINSFEKIFSTKPTVVKSPGRINIIGEHTDYNNGFVMPAAIDKAIYVAISKRDDDEIHLFSESYQESHQTSTTEIAKAEKGWANYILGVADQFVKRGYHISGYNLYVDGDIPPGAGLSSSAALECATAFALAHINGLALDKMEMSLMSQQAEHIFAGVKCGIMDQFASVFGQKNHAILLDCRNLKYEYLPLNLDGYQLVLMNTNVKHSLSDSAYNTRRQQCEQGVAWVKAHHPEIESLRDVTVAQLNQYVKPQNEDVYIKCRYVVEEIARTQQAAVKLKEGDITALGMLMYATHKGLSEIYEVSCGELDFLVNFVRDLDYVLGARMMGGGFGGCTINVVKQQNVAALVEQASEAYESEFGVKLDVYVVQTGDGTSLVKDTLQSV